MQSLCFFSLCTLACPTDKADITIAGKRSIETYSKTSLKGVLPIHSSNYDLTESSNLSPTHVLVLGGGYSASGNQVSLESNIRYFRKIRQNLGLHDANVQTYFADGNDSSRDLQFFDPNYSVPFINQVLAELFGNSKTIYHQYRSNTLQPNGPSSIQSIEQWFDRRKEHISPSNNLIYFTGHGGKGPTKTPHNTTAYLWSNERLKVTDFVKKLNQLPLNQSTILIMVQCYSGGFANVIFKDGDPDKKFTDHARAGFFSTIQSRVAAGCTPDIREDNYREYSTSFWEALCGISRIGRKINKPDYNADGKTSLMEAHSYVCIHSETIDVPLKTSDVLLRKYMGTNSRDVPKKGGEKNIIEKFLPNLFSNESNKTAGQKKIEHTTVSELMAWASHEEKAIFSALSNEIGLKKDFPINEIKKLQEELNKEKEKLQKEKKLSLDQKNNYRDELKKRLKKKYPELVNPYHQKVSEIIHSKEKEVIFSIISAQSTWDNFLKAKEKADRFEADKFTIEKKEAKLLRVRRCVENIFLSQQLKIKGTLEQKFNFQKLQTLERICPEQIWNNQQN